MEPREKVRPIESFTLIYRVLTFAGYYKHLVKPKSHWTYRYHQIYRPVAILITLLLNLMHLTYIYQARDDIETVLEVIMIQIPHLQVLVKSVAWNLYSDKLDRIHDALANDPTFLSSNEKEEEFLVEDKRRIMMLTKRVLTFMAVCASLWTISFFIKRLQDPGTQIHVYIPFATDTWFRYTVAVMVYTCLSNPWNVYGNVSFDCAIAAYYSQARTQLKMIRHNLERLTQRTDENSLRFGDVHEGPGFQYRDTIDPKIKQRFVYIVKKYERVVWYTEEVGGVLEKSIGFGFLSTSVGVCISVNFISSADTPLALVAFLASYSIALLAQVFLYCYFGGLVTEESELLNTSIYMSEWDTLSPGFRRDIMIAMERWLRRIVPRVKSFVVVPLSLGTFIVIVKSTYTLYTVLKAAKSE